jgi:hypothetical protein
MIKIENKLKYNVSFKKFPLKKGAFYEIQINGMDFTSSNILVFPWNFLF